MVQESFTRTNITPPRTPASSTVKDGSLKLSLSDVHASRTCLTSLGANSSLARTVSNVAVRTSASTSTSAVRASPKDVIRLLRDIGEICPRIETLSISLDASSTAGQPALELPITALTAFFERAPRHLVSVKISSAVVSAAGSQDFVELEKAMRLATSWKEMRLEFCEPSSGTLSLDPLLQSLSAAPALQQVALSGTTLTHTGLCTGPSLAKLVHNNSTLKTLTIWGGKRQLDTVDVCALVQALETNTSLRELTLHARGLNSTCGKALSRCLTVNTCLERLILNVSDNITNAQSCSDYIITTTLLAKALQGHNRTLRLLSLDYCPEEDNGCYFLEGDSHDYDFYEYLQIDQHSKTCLRKNAETVREAFTHMLHCNPVLEVLWMNLDNEEEDTDEGDEEDTPASMIVTTEMEMLLRLNRHGIRQALFEKTDSASSKVWVDAVASQSYDINALFYLMSRNPSLCSSSSRHLSTKRDVPTETELLSPTTPTRATKRQRTTAM